MAIWFYEIHNDAKLIDGRDSYDVKTLGANNKVGNAKNLNWHWVTWVLRIIKYNYYSIHDEKMTRV